MIRVSLRKVLTGGELSEELSWLPSLASPRAARESAVTWTTTVTFGTTAAHFAPLQLPAKEHSTTKSKCTPRAEDPTPTINKEVAESCTSRLERRSGYGIHAFLCLHSKIETHACQPYHSTNRPIQKGTSKQACGTTTMFAVVPDSLAARSCHLNKACKTRPKDHFAFHERLAHLVVKCASGSTRQTIKRDLAPNRTIISG